MLSLCISVKVVFVAAVCEEGDDGAPVWSEVGVS